jgi:hypothetical protein
VAFDNAPTAVRRVEGDCWLAEGARPHEGGRQHIFPPRVAPCGATSSFRITSGTGPAHCQVHGFQPGEVSLASSRPKLGGFLGDSAAFGVNDPQPFYDVFAGRRKIAGAIRNPPRHLLRRVPARSTARRSRASPAIRKPVIMFRAPSERRRVRGKDCVLLRSPFQAIASLNSFLPRLADTGRNRKELT